MERGERRSEALAILKDMKKRTESRNKVVSNAAEDLSEVLQQQQVSDSDIDTVWYRYFAQREAYNKDMLDLRFRLREQLTREEWEQVFDHK